MTVALAPPPFLQFFDNQGRPLVGGSLLTQVGGVNTATYQDAAGSVPLPNPIPLNSRGDISNASGISCQMFMTAGVTYTFTLKDAAGNPISQATAVATPGVGVTTASLAASSGSSLVGYIQGGAGSVARFVQDKLRDVVSVVDFGAVPDGSGTSGTDNTTALQAALNSGARKVVGIPGSFLTDTLTIPSGVELDLSPGMTLLMKGHTTSHNPIIRMGTLASAVSRAVLRGGKLVGNSASQTFSGEQWSPGVFIWGSDGCKVIGTEITDCQGDGITNGYDTGRLVGSHGNLVEHCEIYGNLTTRQGVSVTWGNNNRIIYNRISGSIDLELDASNGECKNNLVHGNRGRNGAGTVGAPHTEDLNVSLASLNTDVNRYSGNLVTDNHCYSIGLQYNKGTLIRGNYVVGSTASQARLLFIDGSDDTLIESNMLVVNAAVAVAITDVLRTRGCSGLTVTNNTVKGDTSSIPFHSYGATFSASNAAGHWFRNNQTDSGTYRGGGSFAPTEWARFRIDQTNGGAIAITQIAGVKCAASISRSSASAVITDVGFGGSQFTIDLLPKCNATTAAATTLTHTCTYTQSDSGSNRTITAYTHVPAAAAVTEANFSFASGGGTGTFFVDCLF